MCSLHCKDKDKYETSIQKTRQDEIRQVRKGKLRYDKKRQDQARINKTRQVGKPIQAGKADTRRTKAGAENRANVWRIAVFRVALCVVLCVFCCVSLYRVVLCCCVVS